MRTFLLAFLVTFAFGLTALADPPANLGKTEQLTRVPAFPRGVKLTIPTTLRPVTVAPSGAGAPAITNLWCMPFGSVVKVSCVERTDVFVTMTTTVSFSAGALVDPDGDSTAGNNVGPVSGYMLQDTVPAGGWLEYVLSRTELDSDRDAITGFRGGYCTGNATTVGWPCDADEDCSTSGTCVSPTTTRTPYCAFILLKAVATANVCTVTNPR